MGRGLFGFVIFPEGLAILRVTKHGIWLILAAGAGLWLTLTTGGAEPPVAPTAQDGYVLSWQSVSTTAMRNLLTQQRTFSLRMTAHLTEPDEGRTVGYVLELAEMVTDEGKPLIASPKERRWAQQSTHHPVTWTRAKQRGPFQLMISPGSISVLPKRLKTVRGTVHVLVADEMETVDVALPPGDLEPMVMGGLTFTVTRVERDERTFTVHFDFEREGFGTLTHSGTAPIVRHHELIDAAGAPIAHRPAGSQMGSNQGRFVYRLDADVAAPAGLRLHLATSLSEKSIDFEKQDIPVLPGLPVEPAGGAGKAADGGGQTGWG